MFFSNASFLKRRSIRSQEGNTIRYSTDWSFTMVSRLNIFKDNHQKFNYVLS